MKLRLPTLDTFVWLALAVAGAVAVGLVVWLLHGPSITVTNRPATGSGPAVSALTGKTCLAPRRRPVAVMLASDVEARPLSGLAQADMVFEMPVTPNGITRLMAVFQCGPDPKEIGSIRSARQDFIPLAQGLGAVIAHWGGERDALEHLGGHVIDNVDALLYEGTVFYRRKNVPRPHNGFSTLQLIRDKAADLGYTASWSMPSYPHRTASEPPNLADLVDQVTIPWPQGMDVQFRYDAVSGTYARWRGGTPETDAITGQQIRVSVIAVVQTDASFIRDQYISVRTLGQGTAAIYQNGRRISALWKKSRAEDMLVFTDDKGLPIPFTPGTVWVEFDAPLPAVIP